MPYTCKNCRINFDKKLSYKEICEHIIPKYCSVLCAKKSVDLISKKRTLKRKVGKMSKEEKVFGRFLIPFFTDLVSQHQIDGYYHNYDFYIPEFNLLLEYDGVFWHSKKHNQKKDRKHDIEAKKRGFNISRVTDVEWKNFLKTNNSTKDMLLRLFNYLAK